MTIKLTPKKSYVFRTALALGGVATMIDRADAQVVISRFTFETSGLTFSTSVTAAAIGPFPAESGVGFVSASHAATSTVYSSPAGSGSARSFSANSFVAGDYYQFSVPTTTAQGIAVAFDAVSSSSGPKLFRLDYSTNGTSYVSFSNFTLNTGTTTAFATAATNSAVNFLFDLSGITALNNNSLAAFRLVDIDTTTAPGGTNRIDNFVVTASPVPEPASLALAAIALGGLSAHRRLRRQSPAAN